MRTGVIGLLAAAGLGLALSDVWRATGPDPRSRPFLTLGTSAEWSTSRDSLAAVRERMRGRVLADPGDGDAAVALADALVRAARIEGDAGLAVEAERVIRAALAHSPRDYAALRMLGPVLLAQHRFAAALDAADVARRARPDDGWNYAVVGDALLELGRYDEAFDAFDELNRRRPDPAAYARAAYARELQGDLDGALDAMQMAFDGTGANDPEAQAWYLAQLGHLYLLQGQADAAERAFARAEFVFAGHPYARMGMVRTLVARGRLRDALSATSGAHETPELLALRGDIVRSLGDHPAAQRLYAQAEQGERDGWAHEEPQPAALARLLAERRLDLQEAVAMAERAAAQRQDIHTLDALAWAYFQAGRLEEAARAIGGALRTGTRDPRIRCHAQAIADAAAAGATPTGLICDPLFLIARPAASIASH